MPPTTARSLGPEDGLAEQGAREALAQLELAPAAHEDTGRLLDQGDRVEARASARSCGLTTDRCLPKTR